MDPVVKTPRHAPVSIDRDGDQGEHGGESQRKIEEDPHATHVLSERPVAEDRIENVHGHGRGGHQDVRYGQVNNVAIEGCPETSIEGHG